MNARVFTIIAIIFTALLLAGCTEKKYPENAVAEVNGVIIDEQSIETVLKESEITQAVEEMIRTLQPNSLTIRESVLQALNISENDLNSEQIRYIQSKEREINPLSKNEAFNLQLRKEVLYQEAVRQGYDVTIDEAKRFLVEDKTLSGQSVLIIGDEEQIKKQNEIEERLAEIYNRFGFESEEDYLNQRIDRSAKALAINRMKSQFNKVTAEKLPKPDNDFQLTIDLSNAWDDYTEYLLDKAKIEILKPEYSIDKYGSQWSYGRLDLTQKQ